MAFSWRNVLLWSIVLSCLSIAAVLERVPSRANPNQVEHFEANGTNNETNDTFYETNGTINENKPDYRGFPRAIWQLATLFGVREETVCITIGMVLGVCSVFAVKGGYVAMGIFTMLGGVAFIFLALGGDCNKPVVAPIQ